MGEDEANALIARVRQSIAARTSDALRRVVIELAPAHTAVALAIREPPFDDLPATVAAVRTSYRLLCAADGMLYQLAICRAARQLKLDVHMCRRGEETARAAQRLGVTPADIEEFVSRVGRPGHSQILEAAQRLVNRRLGSLDVAFTIERQPGNRVLEEVEIAVGVHR